MTEAKSSGNVRAIGRALSVLQMINRHRSLSMIEIAKLTDLPYPTAFRIVETLIEEGMVEQERGRKHYRPTQLVQTLSSGYHPGGRIASAAHPHVTALTKRIDWPISVCARVGTSMMILDSTYLITPLTISLYHPGYTFPIIASSSGQAYLAFCAPDERASIFSELKAADGGLSGASVAEIEAVLDDIRAQGYSTHDRTLSTADPGKNSSISAPIFERANLAGTITLVFFASAMPMSRAVAQFAEMLKQTARDISADLFTDGPSAAG